MRVLVLGLPMTGLTSTLAALRALGFATHGFRCERLYQTLKADNVAVADMLLLSKWQKVVKLYPDAKCVLTVRDEEQWLESIRHWFARKKTSDRAKILRRRVFGSATFDRARMIETRRRHEEEVRETTRPLIFRPAHGDGWSPLCEYLGLPVPSVPFPHRNKRKQHESPVVR